RAARAAPGHVRLRADRRGRHGPDPARRRPGLGDHRGPPAGRGVRHRPDQRAALPLVQGDHGGQEEAGGDLDPRRPGHRPLPGGPGRRVVQGRVDRGPPAADQGRDRRRRGRGRQGPGRLPRLPQARLTVAPIKEIPMAEVLVLVDHVDGTVRKTTAEMLTGASRLGEPSAVWIGPADKAQASAPLLARFGAHKVYVVDDPQVTEYLVAPTVEVLAELVGRSSPAAVLLPSSPDGKEVAARLAVR